MWFNMVDGFRALNTLGKNEEEFLFIISFEKDKIFASPLNRLPKNILFQLNSWRNFTPFKSSKKATLKKYPINFKEYERAINRVKSRIKMGDTYLLNLTFPTKIETNLTLREIFYHSKAPFKLLVDAEFVSFSPEMFIEIEANQISTYPMKGTIDAKVENAKDKILNSQKEMAEHTMIVDLMRNDLNMVGSNTKVDEFRFVQKIKGGDKELLQVSSKVSATLDSNWRESLGDILDLITPAGSISGTPKKKTVEIIKEVEGYKRGFYTGVFGVCKKDSLKSAVMIRFIEQTKDSFVYKSGGGVTIDSDNFSEYQEMIDKVYIPF